MASCGIPANLYSAIKHKEDMRTIITLINKWNEELTRNKMYYYRRVIYCACVEGHAKLVDYLVQRPHVLKRGPPIRFRNLGYEDKNLLDTLLFLALYYEHRMIAATLIQKGAQFDGNISGRHLNHRTDLKHTNVSLPRKLNHLSLLAHPSALDLVFARDDVDTFDYFVPDVVLKCENKLNGLLHDACMDSASKCVKSICERAPLKTLMAVFKKSFSREYDTLPIMIAASSSNLDLLQVILSYTSDQLVHDRFRLNAVHYALQFNSKSRSTYGRFFTATTRNCVRFLLNLGIDKFGRVRTERLGSVLPSWEGAQRGLQDTYLSGIIRQIPLFRCASTPAGMITLREQNEEFPDTMLYILDVLDEFRFLWQTVTKEIDNETKNGLIAQKNKSSTGLQSIIHPLEEWYLTTIDYIQQFYDRWVKSKICRREDHLKVICNGLVLATAILEKLLSFPGVSFHNSNVSTDYALFGILLQTVFKIVSALNKSDNVKEIPHPKEYELQLRKLVSLIHGIVCIFLRQGLSPMNEDIYLIRGSFELPHTSCFFPTLMSMLCTMSHGDYYWAVGLLTEARLDDGSVYSDDTDMSTDDSMYIPQPLELSADEENFNTLRGRSGVYSDSVLFNEPNDGDTVANNQEERDAEESPETPPIDRGHKKEQVRHLTFDSSSLEDTLKCLEGQARSLQSLSRLTVYTVILEQERDCEKSVQSLKLPTPITDYLLKCMN